MDWRNKKVLITGAGGFIGSHLTEELVKGGANVTAFVHYNSRGDWGLLELLSQEIKDEITIFSGDVTDRSCVINAVRDKKYVFHLAALIGIPYSYYAPESYINTNIKGTLNILEAGRNEGVGKIIHTSTSEVYGTAQYVPIDERHPLQGQSPYSASKIGADKIAESFYLSFDLPVAIIRPFNTYGPRQSARAVIPTIITQVLTREKIFLGSLRPTRDYTYVKDVVKAFIKVAESPKSIGEVINIGSNFEISIGDLANKICPLVGKNVEIITDPARVRPQDSEVERLWCDNTKAKKLLNWKPKTSLDEGLKKTIEWISDNINLYKPKLYNR